MNKISDLKAGQGKVDIEASVVSKAEPRVMEKYGKELKVCNATVKDESGEIMLTLWNADVDKVNVGDTIRITNGYVSEFNGKKQLTSGKFGKLEVVGAGSQGGEDSDDEGVEAAPKETETKGKKAKKGGDIEDVEF